jgi:c-di-GMP-binding flagellar brake protein YcgR
VGKWIRRLARALIGEDAATEARRAIAAACKERAKLQLESTTTSVANANAMTTSIEHVDRDELTISQPVIGGVPRPLVEGESLKLSFGHKFLGLVTGETLVLGRCKIPSGGNVPIYGYRITMPQELFNDERRNSRRQAMGTNLAREVEIYREGTHKPIRGVVQNLSTSGMQIRTHDSPEPPLRPGERVRLVVHLPPPVGGVNRMVTIARLAGNRNPRHRVIGIAFERDLEGLRELLDSAAEEG